MAGSPERKMPILGRELKPNEIGIGGLFLFLAGVWAAKNPWIALPAITVGLGLTVYSIRKMELEDREPLPK